MLRKLLFAALLALCAQASAAQTSGNRTEDNQKTDSLRHEVLLETTAGNIRIALSDETPLHRDNFLRLVRSGFYDGVLFHRIIPQFMVQAGDSSSRHANPGELLGGTPESYTVPAEIRYPKLFHRYGAVAAAREGDEVNPQRASSASQFYIVTGQVYDDYNLDRRQQRLDELTGGAVKLTRDVREVYKTEGGAPHLDGTYTVFGQVTEGMDAVEIIQWAERDANNRPISDIRILRASVVR